jgi:hypothetical protein
MGLQDAETGSSVRINAAMGQVAADRLRQKQGGRMKRRNRLNGQWSPRMIEMLRSPAYRALSLSAHRLISRIEIELADHGGNDNGRHG